ncbi:hypothetical protein RRG08_000222 [Elysia crispata]|uniref:Uncharacterized protein n=1 Tax=Elysia crispata TaxID=231223 RepID=A0AAE1AX85_9GAST|nr:hypothetical protein RRG08_000222 [Elysia crispata]
MLEGKRPGCCQTKGLRNSVAPFGGVVNPSGRFRVVPNGETKPPNSQRGRSKTPFSAKRGGSPDRGCNES